MPEQISATLAGEAGARPGGRALLVPLIAVAAAAVVWAAPFALDSFALNVLTRSLIYAVLALTVDLLWGFTGILTFGQAAFFGAGAYAAAIVLRINPKGFSRA